MRGISLLVKDLLASQEGLCFINLFSWLVCWLVGWLVGWLVIITNIFKEFLQIVLDTFIVTF